MILRENENTEHREKEQSQPSLSRRMVEGIKHGTRVLTAGLMLASAVQTIAASDASGTEHAIQRLVMDMESDAFQTRDRARKDLEESIDAWYAREQRPYPFRSLLTPGGNWPLEKRRRADRLLRRCDEHELKQLWDHPTQIRIPKHWRKEGPTGMDVLREMEQQTGRRFRIVGRYLIEDMQIRLPLLSQESLPCWELLRFVESRVGGLALAHRTPDDRRDIVYSIGTTHMRMSRGIVTASLEVFRNSANVCFHAEPKISLSAARMRSAVFALPNGTQIDGAVDLKNWSETSVGIPLPSVQSEMKADLTMDVAFEGFRMQRFTIDDPNALYTFRTRTCTFTYDGTKGKIQKDAQRTWWTVPFTFVVPGSDGREQTMFSYRMVAATDFHDPHFCPHFQHSVTADHRVHGTIAFGGSAKGSLIRLPDLPTSTTRTFTFRDIPLAK